MDREDKSNHNVEKSKPSAEMKQGINSNEVDKKKQPSGEGEKMSHSAAIDGS